MYDPLDKAVERLWFMAWSSSWRAGNYGVEGQPTASPSRPGTIRS